MLQARSPRKLFSATLIAMAMAAVLPPVVQGSVASAIADALQAAGKAAREAAELAAKNAEAVEHWARLAPRTRYANFADAFQNVADNQTIAYLGKTEDGVRYIAEDGALARDFEFDALHGVIPLADSNATEVEHFRLIVDHDLIADRRFPIDELPTKTTLLSYHPVDGLTLHRRPTVNGQSQWATPWEGSPGLLLPMRKPAAVERFTALKDRPFSTTDVRVIGLFDPKADGITAEALTFATDQRGVYRRISPQPDLAAEMAQAKGKLFLVVGHVEDGEFIIRDGDNAITHRYPIGELQDLAAQHAVSLVLLGCRTGPGGFIDTVNSLDVATGLRRALGQETYGAFFASLGSEEAPFLLTLEQIGKGQELVFRRLDESRRIQLGAIEVVAVGLISPPFVSKQEKVIVNLIAAYIWLLGGGAIISLLARSTRPIRWVGRLPLTVACAPYRGIRGMWRYFLPPTHGERAVEKRLRGKRQAASDSANNNPTGGIAS